MFELWSCSMNQPINNRMASSDIPSFVATGESNGWTKLQESVFNIRITLGLTLNEIHVLQMRV